MRIGYHVSTAGTIDMAFDRARAIGCNTMQIFASNPRGWALNEIDENTAHRFVEKGNSYGITPVFVHAPYLLNLASPNKLVYEKSNYALVRLIDAAHALNARFIVVHLGSDLGRGKDYGKHRVAEAINSIENYNGVTLLMENEAGQKNSVGSQMEDIVDIYDSLIDKRHVGFCFDTCHAFAAGYDIKDPLVIDNMLSIIDTSKVKVIHLNDAKYELGSHLDRHEIIGKGYIGVGGFMNFLKSKIAIGKPLILETPWKNPEEQKAEFALVNEMAQKAYYSNG